MRYFLLVLGILIILDITYFSFVNQDTILTVNYKPILPDFQVKSWVLYFGMGIYGVLGGFLITYSKVLALKGKLKKLERKTEKSSIASEESKDKVKELEAKIGTLEAALKDALNK